MLRGIVHAKAVRNSVRRLPGRWQPIPSRHLRQHPDVACVEAAGEETGLQACSWPPAKEQ